MLRVINISTPASVDNIGFMNWQKRISKLNISETVDYIFQFLTSFFSVIDVFIWLFNRHLSKYLPKLFRLVQKKSTNKKWRDISRIPLLISLHFRYCSRHIFQQQKNEIPSKYSQLTQSQSCKTRFVISTQFFRAARND